MRSVFSFSVLFFYLLSSDAQGTSRNVLNGELSKCSDRPLTGFYRNGFCETGPDDTGTHVACATMTKDFLEFTRSRGNDLISARPESRFPGLKPGDKWCLCATRWLEAKAAGVAPLLDLKASHQRFLQFENLTGLRRFRSGPSN